MRQNNEKPEYVKVKARKLTQFNLRSHITADLTPEIIKHIKVGSTLYTDEWIGYKNMGDLYDHLFVNHNSKEYVKDDIYTNTIEGFWSLFKRGILGIYHFTSKKHLQKYVDEFVFRHNTRKFAKEQDRFDYLLTNISNKRLDYKKLTA